MLDACLKREKVVKNLINYKDGTNATGIMANDYKPVIRLHGIETHQIVKCYLTLLPNVGNSPLAPGQS